MWTTLVLAAVLLADLNGNGALHATADFIHPPPLSNISYGDNERFMLGEPLDIKWDNITGPLELVVFMDHPRLVDKPEFYSLRKNVTSDLGGMKWSTDLFGREIILPVGQDAVCYFGLVPEGDLTVKHYSAQFNISVPSGMRSQWQGRPPGAASDAAPSSTTDSRPASTSEPDSRPAVSALGVAGMAVGSLLVFMGVFVLVYVCWRRRRRRRRRRSARIAINERGHEDSSVSPMSPVRTCVSVMTPSSGRQSSLFRLQDVQMVRTSELYAGGMHELP